MPYTQADIDELKRIIATGAESAEFADRKAKFRSLEELQQLLAAMELEVNGPGGTGTSTNYRLVSTSKGFCP